jgi:hypothetical protein
MPILHIYGYMYQVGSLVSFGEWMSCSIVDDFDTDLVMHL